MTGATCGGGAEVDGGLRPDKQEFGVEPICRVLKQHGIKVAHR